jgi:hypothetical protein
MITELIKRSAATALKLPFALAWDCLSLGNMGQGATTSKVLRSHKQQKELDDLLELQRRLLANKTAYPPAKEDEDGYLEYMAICCAQCRCDYDICESVLAGGPCEERVQETLDEDEGDTTPR